MATFWEAYIAAKEGKLVFWCINLSKYEAVVDRYGCFSFKQHYNPLILTDTTSDHWEIEEEQPKDDYKKDMDSLETTLAGAISETLSNFEQSEEAYPNSLGANIASLIREMIDYAKGGSDLEAKST